MEKQTVPPSQIIVVCDGLQNDEVTDYISKIKEKTLYTIVEYSSNMGLAYALNKGIMVAENELIARMDSDDYSLAERCEKQLDVFMHNPDMALVGTAAQEYVSDPFAPRGAYRIKPGSIEEIKEAIRRSNPFIHSTVMFRKSVVLKCGGYDSKLLRRQDYDLFTKIVAEGYAVCNLTEILLLFKADDNFAKRNKDRQTCKDRMIVQKRVLQRGQCSLGDYLYVGLTMLGSRVTPAWVYKLVYRKMKTQNMIKE
jgi:glycosyltransferase involved in cell wall biosynthesis